MFNKKTTYSIRKLSLGVCSIVIGTLLLSNPVSAQTGKTTELPPSANQAVPAEDVEQPETVENTTQPTENREAANQPIANPINKVTPTPPPLPPMPPMGPPMGPPPLQLPTIVQYLLENTEEKVAPDEDLGNGIPEGKDIPGYELVSRFPRRSGGFLPDGGHTANITLKFYYRPKLVTEVPNEAPQVTPEEAKTTEFETIDGVTLAEGVLDKDTKPARTFETYEFVETRETLTGVKHIYKKIVTEVPNEAPIHQKEKPKVTHYRYVNKENILVEYPIPNEDSVVAMDTLPSKPIKGYIYLESHPYSSISPEDGYDESERVLGITHLYIKIQVPNEAPQVTPEEAKTTEFETIDGVTLAEGVLDKDTKPARTFETYEFVETRETLTGVKHIYKKVVTEVPNEAPQVTPEEAKTTEFETIDGVTLAEGVLDKETKPARTFETYEFVETRETLTGIKHIYKKVVSEVPNEAPQVTPEEAKTTEFETIDGVTLAEGVLDKETKPARTFETYEFVETRETLTGIKHIYKKVVTEVPEPHTPEKETPQKEKPETPKSNKLPETGEYNLLPISLGLTTLGIALITWRKRQEQ